MCLMGCSSLKGRSVTAARLCVHTWGVRQRGHVASKSKFRRLVPSWDEGGDKEGVTRGVELH